MVGVTDSLFLILMFSLCASVLGTLAATYLCVAVIVKYYLMEDHPVVLTPAHSQGSVTLFLVHSLYDCMKDFLCL